MKEYNNQSLYDMAIKNGLLDKSITYKQFSTVVKDFNKKVSLEILDGYIFKSPIGKIEIRKRERKVAAIDWNESKKYRADLIAEGKIPFNKDTAPDGIKWFKYFTHNMDYLWKWTKHATYGYWRFQACKDNKRKIGKVVREKVANQTIKEVEYGFL